MSREDEMKAISLHQPWASLLVTRTIERRYLHGQEECPPTDTGPMVKRFIDSDKPCPPSIIGQHVAFASTKAFPDYARRWMAENDSLLHTFGWCFTDDIDLPLGCVVGSGTITASYPIVSHALGPNPQRAFVRAGYDGIYIQGAHPEQGKGAYSSEITNQLPYGDFSVGRYAWLIEDAAPTTERCPWCWGDSRTSFVDGCCDDGRCDPIPVTGRQGFWNWEP